MSTEQRRLAGRYVLETPIGRGGMGEVWRGTDTVLGREVAIKTIDLRSVHDETGAARFEREARATAGLNHPGIVTVHDSGVEDDTAFLVMELLPGPSLAERLREGPLPVEEVVAVGEQVATALDAAHARGLVHRDIKPGNIAYAEDGRIRVLDFGITQLGDTPGSQALTATHTVMGTAEYLAPEQALGGRVDGRADLYALGCVLYALLVGHAPFRGPTPVATMMMHANDPVPDVRELRPDTPDWLAAVVTGLLAKDPDDRPMGAAAVAAALGDREPVAGVATTVLPAAAAGAAGAALGADATRRLDRVPPPPPPTAPVTTAPRRDDRRGGGGGSALTWLLGIVALVAVGLLLWNLLGLGESGDPGASPSTTPASSTPAPATSTPAPTTEKPSPTPTPSETADLQGDVERSLGALSDGIADQESQGALEKDAGKKLNDAVRDVRQALRSGDEPDKVVEQADKVDEELGKLVADGKVTAETQAQLQPLVDDLRSKAQAYADGS
ncbi:protein kinase domain-containing protein [Oryzobacter telluris]|uniref:serine/threonine-protein kinase n=1 Tax=Oryzobacter telluris TaxID=3149179 RepID=UPI00370D4992